MKADFFKNRAGFVILTMLLACMPVRSQEASGERPEPGSVQVPAQDDERAQDEPSGEELGSEEMKQEAERRGKVGFVRLWNFAHKSSAEGVAVFLSRGSGSLPPPEQRLWLGRGSRSGELREYDEFEPGMYEVFVQRDASRQGAMVELPEKFEPDADNLLPSRLGLRVAPGFYQTVLLYDDAGGLAARVLDDSAVVPTKLRLFNYTREYRPAISILGQGRSVTLVEQLDKEHVLDIPASARVATLEVAYPTQVEGFTGRLNVECDFAAVRSCSLLVFYDRYGRLTARAIEDAPK